MIELYINIIYCNVMDDLKSIIGHNIKFYRKNLGLNQEKLAELIDIAPPSLSSLETGQSFPSYNTIIALIDKLNIRPYQLFLSDDESLKIEDTEIQALFTEKLKHLDFEKRKMIFTIIEALADKKD